ncbi:hypothetical protein [Klebsiella pneumoniae]|nr:hypothetical protein [Klebsiella pneumoniae]MDT9892755.1 hypothetical protein [Klebsiella pneumoniae]MDU0008394.1 hypothetical protein [Klebsiella pneumoniae]CAH5325178.1 hypothetical protein AI2846V1_3005 [Klebsiella pneumoniae]
MKKNLNFSEWLGLVTSVSALYSYIYYYKYWRFFGINAYDYFSYIDALQHSIPSIIMVLTLSQALILSFTYHIFFDRKAIVSFYRYSYSLAKTNHYKNVLKQSIVLFVLIILFDYFLRWFLNSGMLSSTAVFIVVVILSIVLITVGALSFSYFFMLNGIRRGAGIKNNLIVFYFFQIPLLMFFSSFNLPMVSAFYFKIHENAQVVFKEDGVIKTKRLLGITKDYFIMMDDGRGIVRKTDALQYVIYNEN